MKEVQRVRRWWSSQILCGTVHLQVLKFDLMIFLVNYSIEKPQPDGLALAFQECKLAKAVMKPLIWPGLAWPGLWPQARPCTALGLSVDPLFFFFMIFHTYQTRIEMRSPTTIPVQCNRHGLEPSMRGLSVDPLPVQCDRSGFKPSMQGLSVDPLFFHVHSA